MTTPRVPSSEVRVVPGEAPVGIPSSEIVYLVGPTGAGAAGQTPTEPTAQLHSIEAFEAIAGTDGMAHDAAAAILGQARASVVYMPVEANATPAQVIASLQNVRQVDPAPTKLYAPGQTVPGSEVGTLKAAMDVDDTEFDFAVTPNPRLPDGTILVIEGEYVRIDSFDGADTYTITRGHASTQAAGHGAGTTVYNLASPVTAALEQLCEELECLAIADGPDSVAQFVSWSNDAGNTKANVLGAYNQVNGMQPGGYILGAAIAHAARFNRARGISFAPVGGVSTLAHRLSYSNRAGVDSDLQSVVGAYGSAVTRRNGAAVIVGDTFRGLTDARRIWSVSQTIHALSRFLDHVQDQFIGDSGVPVTLNRVANQLQRQGRRFVSDRELQALTVVPHPTKNTAASLNARDGFFQAAATPIIPLNHLETDLSLTEPILLTIGG